MTARPLDQAMNQEYVNVQAEMDALGGGATAYPDPAAVQDVAADGGTPLWQAGGANQADPVAENMADDDGWTHA